MTDTTLDLDAIKARANAAYDGPWWHEEVDGDALSTVWAEEDGDGGYDVIVAKDVLGQPDAEFIAHARTDIPALLAQHDVDEATIKRLSKLVHDDDLALCREALREADAENERLRTAMQEALAELKPMSSYSREEIAEILTDALELDGAPQDGGVTDPHETSGPPAVERTPEENAEGLGLLVRWTNMHHMSVTRGTLDAVDRGGDIPGLLDAECARLVEHECGWQTERRATRDRYTSRPEWKTRVVLSTGTAGVVTLYQPSDDPQQVRVRWDDDHTTTVRCEQLRPEVTA